MFIKPKDMPDMYMLLRNGKKWLMLFALCFALGIPALSFAVPANPGVRELKQPDGSIVMGVLRGDEWSNWAETVSGYTIDRGSNGYWYYVTGYDADNKPVLSSVYAHEEPAGLSKHLSPSRSRKTMRIENRQKKMPAAPYGPFNGKILMIMVQFNDIKGTYTESDFANELANNVKDYYYKASNGKVTLSPANESFGTANNGVVGWLTLNYNHPNPGKEIGYRNQQIASDAITAADTYVDFASYDTNHDGYVDSSELAVVVIVAGYEYSTGSYTPSVWGHRWVLESLLTVDGVYVCTDGYAQYGEVYQTNSSDKHKTTMGIIVHELGHLLFGLPDLYDIDNSSKGIGYFCLMSYGMWGAASTEAYGGATPVLPSAWVRSTLGWIDAYITPGNLAFTAIGASSATAYNTVYKAPSGIANEYFLVENRQPQGYDRGLERWFGSGIGGLAIFHIDDNVAENYDDTHRRVDLVEADGTEVGSGGPTDLWYAGNAITFNDTSSPNSKLYNGSSSGFAITSISGKDIIMTADTSGTTVQYALAVTKSGTGSGVVTSNLGGISCGAMCTVNFAPNTQVTLTAKADSGSIFAGWSGDCSAYGTISTCTVTMSATRNVTARFDKSTGNNNNTVFSHVKKDFDGDGKGDILWHNAKTGDVVIWLMNGASISQGNYVIRSVPLDWQIKAIGDFNGDGKADVLWQSTTNGNVALWLMNGLTINSGDSVAQGISWDWTPKAVGDFDGDGKADVLWHNASNGAVVLWLMDGAKINRSDYVVKSMPSDWTLKAVADLNKDGKSDMVWQASNGDIFVWIMNGASISGGGFAANGIAGNWQIKAIGDFDGNGNVDVLWQDTTSGDVAMWLMNGLMIGSSNYLTRGLPGNWQVLTAGDFNGDAKSDVLLQDTNNGDVYIWLMDGVNITGGGFVSKALELDWWTQ